MPKGISRLKRSRGFSIGVSWAIAGFSSANLTTRPERTAGICFEHYPQHVRMASGLNRFSRALSFCSTPDVSAPHSAKYPTKFLNLAPTVSGNLSLFCNLSDTRERYKVVCMHKWINRGCGTPRREPSCT